MLTLVMSFPGPQTWAGKKATSWLNNTYDLQSSVRTLRYSFPNQFVFGDLFLPGESGDTLIFARKLNVHFTGYSVSDKLLTSNEVNGDGLQFNWLIEKGDTLSNLIKFAEKFKDPDREEDIDGALFGLEIGEIVLSNSQFSYHNLNCDTCHQFLLNTINLNISDFDLEGPFLTADIKNLSTTEQYSYDIEELKGQFAYLPQEISLKNGFIKTNESEIIGDLALKYDTTAHLKYFVDKVEIHADLKEGTAIASKELIHFVPKFPDFKIFRISGNIEGPIVDLKGENLNLFVSNKTHLKANIEVKNPLSAESIHITANDVDFSSSIEDAQEVFSIFSEKALPEQLVKMGKVDFTGNYKGFLTNFKAKGNLQTEIGEVDMDIFFNYKDSTDVSYNGIVVLDKVNLGEIIQDTTFGLVSATMNLDGKGLTANEMDTRLIAQVDRFEFREYPYSNISIDGKILTGDFKGDLKANDPNLKFDFSGDASLSRDISRYDFVAKIDTANLLALNLTKDSIVNIASELDINFKALNYDKWQGSIKVVNTIVENASDFYFFKDILVQSNGFSDSNKYLTVRSNILDLDLKGNYTFKGVSDVFMHHSQKFIKTTSRSYGAPDQNFNFDINVKNTRVLSEIFIPELYMEPNSTLKGSYKAKNNKLNIHFTSPGFEIKKNTLSQVDLDYYGSATKSQLGFNIAKTNLSSGLEIDSLNLSNQLFVDTIFFDFKWVIKDSIGSKATLKGFALQNDVNGFQFGIAESNFNIGSKGFEISEDNQIFIDSGGVRIQNLVISGETERISINGNLSKSPNEILRLNFQNFNMDLINYFVRTEQSRFKGNIFGDLILTQALSSTRFAADIHVDSLKMNNTLLGNLSIGSDWNYGSDDIALEAKLSKGELKSLIVNGVYSANKRGEIDFNVDFDQLHLAVFNPFVKVIGENLRGYIDGSLKINGSLSQPLVSGDLTLPKAAITISILQTDYNLAGIPKINILENRINLPDLTLRDTQFGTEGKLNGSITHKNFKDFHLDLNINADELLALNTTSTTSNYYYGRAFVTGLVTIKGPVDDLSIKANVAAKRNSKFYLPLDAATEVKRSDYVTFVNPYQKDNKSELNRVFVNKGISLDFNVLVDQNSEVQLIIDQQTGTKLSVAGEGEIRIKVDPFQDIQMFGTYTATEGDFLLSLENVVKKRFIVQRGGTVSWNGSPTEALVKISAIHETRADPSPLVPDYEGGRTLVNVILDLSGEIQNLNNNFSIKVPRADATTQTFIANRLSEGDKMNQQVFSLLALNIFLPDQGISGGDIVTNGANAFEFLASQASNWINQATGDYNVTLSYQNSTVNSSASDGTNSQEEVEVGVSKRFFDNRVTVNGRVGVALDENQRENQFAGDFDVEYNITEDGRFRTKAFSRSVQDQYSFTEQNYQQGIGLFYKVDFDTWKELVDAIRRKKTSESIDTSSSGNAIKEEDLPPSKIENQ